MTTLFIDGGCSNNTQKNQDLREMISLVCNDEGTVLDQSWYGKGGSNNIAELYAVLKALEWAAKNNETEITIKTDSKNNLAWVAGRIGKKLNDRQRVLEIKEQIDLLRWKVNLSMEWLPREENLSGRYLESNYKL